MSNGSDEIERLQREYHALLPARGHVSYLCASRVVPNALVAGGWPPGIHIRRLSTSRPTWFISGRDRTSAEGEASIDVSEYLVVPDCAPLPFQEHWGPAIIDGRPAFFTTQHSEEPVLLSAKVDAEVHEEGNWGYRDLLDGHFYSREVEYKVTATVRAWNLDSDPVAVSFSWFCIAEGAMRYTWV